jgi:anti-repressor protein
MLQRTEKGKEARRCFIKCERRLRALAPKTFAEALQLAADQAKLIKIKDKQITIQKDKRELQQMLTEIE